MACTYEHSRGTEYKGSTHLACARVHACKRNVLDFFLIVWVALINQCVYTSDAGGRVGRIAEDNDHVTHSGPERERQSCPSPVVVKNFIKSKFSNVKNA